MSSYEQLLKEGREYLEAREVPQWDIDAWYLLEHLLHQDRSWYFLHMKEEASEEMAQEYRVLLERRGERVPLQQILGTAWFMGLEFQVTKDVLIPRQDTEILVEEALKRLEEGSKILDLCTGSGCILLSVLYNRDRCSGVGVDISPMALKVAEENSRRLAIPATFLKSDLLEAVEGQYQMILSNPPYIPSADIEKLMDEVQYHEPSLALDGGDDGLDFYRRIIQEAKDYLEDDGWLLLEIGYDQGHSVSQLLEKQGYQEIETVQDLSGLDRVVLGRKCQEVRDV